MTLSRLFSFLALLMLPGLAFASAASTTAIDFHATTTHGAYLALALFFVAYGLVMTEEFTHLRKSKPVIVASGFIWVIVAILTPSYGNDAQLQAALSHNILEYAYLFLFLLVAMTYVSVMEERQVFMALRCWLVNRNYNYRQLFWATGILSFFISPIADNLTTALLMCAVVIAVGGKDTDFILLACINIVVAANAGGAFSPFGDITTLMVWQKGILSFFKFFQIFIPSVVSYVIPAAIMHFWVPDKQPDAVEEDISMKYGAMFTVVLFLLTIITAISFHHLLHLPPTIGMMTGLGYLTFYSYYLKRREKRMLARHHDVRSTPEPFDIFNNIKDAEWDSLFFFYGVILCVGGLATLGFLSEMSNYMYGTLGPQLGLSAAHSATPANILVGILSAIVDNIPVMYAVLTMNPHMSEGQWLLVTLTAGIGGSMLSVGSAAGVALMGQARGIYTFMGHLRWTWAIALGYIGGVAAHLWLMDHLFTK